MMMITCEDRQVFFRGLREVLRGVLGEEEDWRFSGVTSGTGGVGETLRVRHGVSCLDMYLSDTGRLYIYHSGDDVERVLDLNVPESDPVGFVVGVLKKGK